MLLACSENPRALSSRSNDAEGMGIVIEVRICCIVGDSLIGIKSQRSFHAVQMSSLTDSFLLLCVGKKLH